MYTDGSGIFNDYITVGRHPELEAGDYIAVTATDWDDNSTSEASPNFPLTFAELKVTNTSDLVNGNTSSVLDLVAAPGADGISLREAILAANNQDTQWGTNHIMFDIPGSGPHIIQPTSPLPQLLTTTYINGWTEPDWLGSPSVRLDGSLAGASNGIDIHSQWCFLSGFAIVNFSGHGVVADEGWGQLMAMYIGVLEDGVTPAGNGGFGVSIQDTDHWLVGNNLDDLTIISDNTLGGVQITGSDAFECEVAGCHIGTDVTGNNVIGSQPLGVVVENGANHAYIGDFDSNEWNVIAGHTKDGVLIEGSGTDENRILGNHIGIGRNGTSALTNDEFGVHVRDGANATKVGEPDHGNVISGNGYAGVGIYDASTTDTEVYDNIIGLNASGTSAIPNTNGGIQIVEASRNIIGSTQSNAGNVISGNGGAGVGIYSPSCSPCENEIVGNIIGLNVVGNNAVGNAVEGISIVESHGNIIGGTTGAHRNVISGNGDSGIIISSANSDDNVIQGNYIGTDITGTLDLGNGEDGVALYGGPQNTLIGGATTGARNVISEMMVMEFNSVLMEWKPMAMSYKETISDSTPKVMAKFQTITTEFTSMKMSPATSLGFRSWRRECN